MQVYGNGISPWRLAPATRSVFGVRRFISAFKPHVSFIFNFALPQEQAGGPEGSERRTSGLRMAPGDVAHVPRTPSPVAEAGPVAGHFRSRARLRRLLAGLRLSTLHRSLRSLRQRGFAHYVRLRHYRSSLTCQRQVIPSHSFAVRTRACCAPRIRRRSLTYVPRNGIAALFICRVSGYADRPMLCLCWLPARPPEGHWRAHPAAASCRPPRWRQFTAGVRAGCPFSSAPPVRL